MFRTAEEALTFFSTGEWGFQRSLNYRLGGGVGSVVGRATWRPWPTALTRGSTASVDGALLPEREQLLLYDEVHSRTHSSHIRRRNGSPTRGRCHPSHCLAH